MMPDNELTLAAPQDGRQVATRGNRTPATLPDPSVFDAPAENYFRANAATMSRRRRSRRRVRFLTMLLFVAAPTSAATIYLHDYAADQYVTEFRFSVRQAHPIRAESSSLASSLGGANPLLAALTDSETTVQYLKSRQVIDDMSATVDLDAIYSWPQKDFWARLDPAATSEERARYWRKIVDPDFDMTSGIVTVKVRAFRPEDSLRVATTVLGLSEKLVNELSSRSHNDAVGYAEAQASANEKRLKEAEAALVKFRNANAVMYPALQANADTAIQSHLRESLSDLRSTYNSLLAQKVMLDGPQMRTLKGRIAATEAELASVQGGMAATPAAPSPQGGNAAAIAANPSLASVLGGYSALEVEERISEKVYERSLTALQDARNEANQQGVYLNAFVRPSLPQESTYPIRWRILLETALGGFLAWCL